jgi:ADP-ribose pyrophosphatase
MHLFVARELTLGETDLDEGEEIERVVVAWDEAIQLVAAGEIQDAKSLVGLLWHDRSRR